MWKNLINNWCINNYGLTIPYIVGKEIIGGNDISIKNLLLEIDEDDEKYIISRCDELEEYIIGIHKPEYPPLSLLKNFGSLYIYDKSEELDNFESFDSLCEFLIENYNQYIIAKTYSKNYDTKEWETL